MLCPWQINQIGTLQLRKESPEEAPLLGSKSQRQQEAKEPGQSTSKEEFPPRHEKAGLKRQT